MNGVDNDLYSVVYMACRMRARCRLCVRTWLARLCVHRPAVLHVRRTATQPWLGRACGLCFSDHNATTPLLPQPPLHPPAHLAVSHAPVAPGQAAGHLAIASTSDTHTHTASLVELSRGCAPGAMRWWHYCTYVRHIPVCLLAHLACHCTSCSSCSTFR